MNWLAPWDPDKLRVCGKEHQARNSEACPSRRDCGSRDGWRGQRESQHVWGMNPNLSKAPSAVTVLCGNPPLLRTGPPIKQDVSRDTATEDLKPSACYLFSLMLMVRALWHCRKSKGKGVGGGREGEWSGGEKRGDMDSILSIGMETHTNDDI